MKRRPARGSPQGASNSIRGAYERYGADHYYQQRGATYRNPHEASVRLTLGEATARWGPDLSRVLDLACGSGEATLALRDLGYSDVDGIDPYTGDAYLERTGRPAEPLDFAQIAGGALDGRRYSLIVCSFALHLAEPSRLPLLLLQLARCSPALLVLTPHKRPRIDPTWGWHPIDQFVRARVHARFYRSTLFATGP